jgi:hypothetical protein
VLIPGLILIGTYAVLALGRLLGPVARLRPVVEPDQQRAISDAAVAPGADVPQSGAGVAHAGDVEHAVGQSHAARGSIANLIVVEGARKRDVHVSFSDYLRVGIPVTIATMAFGIWWVY